MPDNLTAIALFTRDLRVHDNPVLATAARADRVLPVFVRDDRIAAAGFSGEPRRRFLDQGLADLDRSLQQLGAGLVLREGDPVTEIGRLVEQHAVAEVHIAADVSGYAATRRRRLHAALRRQRCELIEHDGVTTIQPPGAVAPSGSDHFSVFTPYFRRWHDVGRRRVVPVPERLRLPDGVRSTPIAPGEATPGWRGGETEARKRANCWFADGLTHYEDRHDDLAADATSRLSPYLHLGQLSATELAGQAARRPGRGSAAFLRQLAWRDFHAQVLAARPRAAWQDYRPRGDDWADDDSALDAWKAGETGYPLVDAGMRELAATGWMHNRARLVVASFLTKTLYIDWRLGARYFLDTLVDGDLANNNLNWQWVAGTGTDSRPNRVLNPVRQTERYDPARRLHPPLGAGTGRSGRVVRDRPTVAAADRTSPAAGLPGADRRPGRRPRPVPRGPGEPVKPAADGGVRRSGRCRRPRPGYRRMVRTELRGPRR